MNEKLRAIRKSKGITQKFVANSLNLPVATYNGYELGRRKIHVELLKEIATVLEEPIQNFFEMKIYESKNDLKDHTA
ncbi:MULTISPECIES: helix-turn-helix domain-containing protein [Bacillus]|uniref:helix-turn-helix domain-containing protein n=1 Tax=Bacillus TaxID=1386 RepID=UPI001F5DCFE8|nr:MULTISPECIES: helix-turn-helix transcriptional regulator [Bacillus]MDS9998654.1 helix-turn-helix domain-containing protein [Bacillus atrophaeus]